VLSNEGHVWELLSSLFFVHFLYQEPPIAICPTHPNVLSSDFVDKYSNSTFVSSSKVLKLELCLKMSHLNIKLIDIALGQMKESLNEHVKVLDDAINRLELKGSWLLTSEQQKVRQSLIQLRNKMRDEGQAVPEVIVKREESRYVSLKY